MSSSNGFGLASCFSVPFAAGNSSISLLNLNPDGCCVRRNESFLECLALARQRRKHTRMTRHACQQAEGTTYYGFNVDRTTKIFNVNTLFHEDAGCKDMLSRGAQFLLFRRRDLPALNTIVLLLSNGLSLSIAILLL